MFLQERILASLLLAMAWPASQAYGATAQGSATQGSPTPSSSPVVTPNFQLLTPTFTLTPAPPPSLSQADAWFEEGRSTLQAAPLKQAKEAYLGLVAIAADPVSLECQLARAGLYLSMEEDLIHRRDPAKKFLEEGLQWALKAEKQKPDSAQIHALLGNLYGQKIALGDIFTAMDCGPKSGDENKKALKLDPEDARVQAAQGRMYLNAPGFAGGDVRKALACFKKSLELDPQSDETWVWLSRAYRKLNQPKDRAEALQQALKLNPKNLSARMEQNDLEKSQAH